MRKFDLKDSRSVFGLLNPSWKQSNVIREIVGLMLDNYHNIWKIKRENKYLKS